MRIGPGSLVRGVDKDSLMREGTKLGRLLAMRKCGIGLLGG
jgi:hypothetical protein